MKDRLGADAARVSLEAPGIVSRLRQGLDASQAFFRAPARLPKKPVAVPAVTAGAKLQSFNSRIAELLLVNRLKARIYQRAHAPEILERAAHVLFVTCRNWFSAPGSRLPQRRNPL